MHLQTVAATLLVAGAAASPFRRQTSNETYCDGDLPETKPSTTSAHYPPYPVNTTIPGVPSHPGAGGNSPSYPGKPSNPGGNSPSYPGKPSNPGGETPSNPSEPSTGGNSPSTPSQASTGGDSSNSGSPSTGNGGSPSKGGDSPSKGGDSSNSGNPSTGNGGSPSKGGDSPSKGGDSPSPAYPGKPSAPGASNPSNPGGNSPSNPGGNPGGNSPSYPGKPSIPSEAASNPGGNSPSNPGGNSPSYPGKPSAPGSSARPWVPYPQNTSVASVIPSFTTIPGVALPTVPVPSTTIPAGNNSTASVPTPSSTAPASNVPYGVPISKCTVPGDFALTFDDGPFTYTNHVLDLLAEAGAKATFFVNGENFGNINQEQDVVKRMIADGHQIGSHTYSHPDLATLGDAEIISEMTTLEDALINIIGKYPTYMRPPYFSWNDNTLSILKALGYHVIHADIDSLDYANNAPLGNLASVGIFEAGVDKGGSIALAHEVHQNTAEYLVPEFLRIIKEKGLRAVTVGECLGDPEANWYKTKRTSTPTATASKIVVSITSTATPTGVIGPDGACGGSEGYVCKAGFCCSEYGFCGSSEGYCGTGCQPLFGVCGAAAPAPSSSSATGTASAPAATHTGASGIIGPDGACGGSEGYVCQAGFCCSEYGFCGSSEGYCGTGCQPLFGVCGVAAPPSGGSATGTASAPAATHTGATGGVSTDGSCGGANGYTCPGSTCCSQYGFCGSTTAHCGTGCQPLFGLCGAAAPAPSGGSAAGSATGSASTPAATHTGATGGVSTDGSCGGTNGYTCPGSTCCSKYGFCGSTTAHCGTGCQPLFGTCS